MNTIEEGKRYVAHRYEIIKLAAQLKEVESNMFREVAGFAAHTVSGALLALNKSQALETSKVNEPGPRIHEVDGSAHDTGPQNQDAQSGFPARQRTEDEFLNDCVATANKLHTGLAGIANQLQTGAAELAVPDHNDLYCRPLPIDDICEYNGLLLEVITIEKASARFDLTKARIIRLYHDMLKDWGALLTDAEPAIKALEQYCEARGFAKRSYVQRYSVEGPHVDVVPLAWEVLHSYGMLKFHHEAVFATAAVLSPSTFEYQTVWMALMSKDRSVSRDSRMKLNKLDDSSVRHC
ncbi:hypothetical protein LTR27_009932 [Elasticomyces elasticus]|nr:hypothetical protein LTR27_009932 [Elasticomyces elasticus]